MNRYDDYIDSGISQIGQIPSSWTIVRFSKVNYIRARLGWKGLKADEYVEKGYPFLSAFNIVNNRLCWDELNYITQERYDESPEIKLTEGDILLVKDGAGVGKCARVDTLCKGESTVNSSLAVITPNELVHYRFEYYYLLSPLFQDVISELRNGMGVPHLTQESMKEIHIPLPELTEQIAISDYLDEKVSNIDSMIADARASIEEYKSWKASIIYEAVTKGLDPNVEMKDSGVEWIGNIPEKWSVTKTLYALSMPITDGPHTTPELFDDGVPFVSAEAVSCGKGKIAFDHIRGYISEEFYQECCLKYVPQINDIYMIKSGATTGTVSYVDTDIKFTIWSPLAVFRVNEDRIHYKYLFYFLQSDAYQKQVQLGWSYGTQQNIGMRTLESLKICMPPLVEQYRVAEYLDGKCSVIDALISEKEALIVDLESYKKSLIYEVVTGKRKVV